MKDITKLGYKICYQILNFFPETNARLNLGQKAARAFVARKLMLNCAKSVNIGKNLKITWEHVSIGKFSGIGNFAKIEGAHIGADVLMGEYCCIYRKNHCFLEKDIPIIRQGYSDDKIVYIGDDVWLGDRVMIMAGVRINDGAVVAAGSIVTKDVEAYAVVAGVPAKMVSKRK